LNIGAGIISKTGSSAIKGADDVVTATITKVGKETTEEAIEAGVKKGAIDIANSLSKQQKQNLDRFIQKIPANSKESVKIYKTNNGELVFEATSLGKVPGSKAVYRKTVDSQGNTISYNKITYDQKGNVVHNKDKFNVK
jgi:hypothetical protein